ncbi:hypothetical protein NQZ79_g1221 [Umbelopsis isabellina]|nr:hypothetical protein NQZ79_g1221 [Umbelopsis isabellina]
MDESDDSVPVNFKALKERWQRQEVGDHNKSIENSPRSSPLNTPPKLPTPASIGLAPIKPVHSNVTTSTLNVRGPADSVKIPVSPEPRRQVPAISPVAIAKKGTPPPRPVSPSTGRLAPKPPVVKDDQEITHKAEQDPFVDSNPNLPSKRVSLLSQQFQGVQLQQPRNGANINKPPIPSKPTNPSKEVATSQAKLQHETNTTQPIDYSSRRTGVDHLSGSLKAVPSPEHNYEKSPEMDQNDESVSESEEDSEEDSDEEEEEQSGDQAIGMHDIYSRSPIRVPITSNKNKRAPPPPPVSRRNRIAQLQQQSESPGHKATNASQDGLRHMPVKSIPTETTSRLPIQDAVEKPPSLNEQKTRQTFDHLAAPLLPPRPNLSGRTQNDTELSDQPIMNRPIQSPKPLSRAKTIGGGYESGPPLPNRPTDSRASPLSRSSSVYRDSSSGDSYTPGTSEGHASDNSSPGLQRSQTIARTERLFAPKLYPDHANANRSPPYVDGPLTVHCRGQAKIYAISGSTVATGSHSTKIYNIYTGDNLVTIDHSASNDVNNRVCSMAFAPSTRFEDEGKHLWVGLNDGSIMVIDAQSGEILGKRTDVHSHPVTLLLRYHNQEIWTIDDNGSMNIWPVIHGSLAKGHHHHPLELHTRRDKVSGKLNIAQIMHNQLWLASGRVLDVYQIAADSPNVSIARVRIPNNVGNITQLAFLPYHQGKAFVGHDDGQITVWSTETITQMQIISLSIYGVCSMLAVGDYHLWIGYNTGMIYVYDTRPERWLVVKMWKAHQGQVINMVLDESTIARDQNIIQVASLDANGVIQVWDGLLSDNWRDQEMNKRMTEYCDYRDAKILISSWNIDANKPEKFDPRDEQKVREWLTSMRDPDIIAVGIQEIVDLESKKQTAKSFFSTKKKSTVVEEEELLTHRYRLWHNYLVQVLASEYGTDAYTVVKTEQLVGLFSCIFVRTSEADRIFHKDSTVVKTGLKVMSKSIHGNKGGIAIRFLFDHTSLCFVNCHLAAGQSHVRQRNSDAEGILQLANLEPLPQYYDVFVNGGDGNFVLDHELCFMSGDFNYRIDMSREQVLKLLSGPNKDAVYTTLQKEDQLRKQTVTNPLFKLLMFNESPIRFDPTYKYDPGTDFYDRSEKKRIPAWCDRVLYRGPYLQNEHYMRHEPRASDHRPISAGFTTKVKTIDDQRRDRIVEKVELAWHQNLERLVQKKKIEWLLGYDLCDQRVAQQTLASANWNMMEALRLIIET